MTSRRQMKGSSRPSARGWKSPSPHAWERVAQGSLSENIVGQVRSSLFAGRLKPGDYLGTEASLSESFGVSRVAIRDALKSLQAHGIIESRKGAGGGIRVANGDPDRFADALAVQLTLVGVSMREIIDAHFTVETASAELATRYATASDTKELRDRLERAAACLQRSDMNGFIEGVIAFHSALARASHNRALAAQLKGYLDVLTGFYHERASQ